ncbi:DUF4131 domain-containing protein [Parvularcula sp. ZS-1/3]|uniref:DUF4131 domain-containing protein n=2 Tax=Parvularcula mediterranea TaxID=2732508 RepID=A0A7Y3W605_9PROT|nr:DUF4131 domain-containing protein [Parvularcula mediterranea]
MALSWNERLRNSARLGAGELFAKPRRVGLARVLEIAQDWAEMEARRFILLAPCLMAAGILLWLGTDEPPGLFLLLPLLGVTLASWAISVRQMRDGPMLGFRMMSMVLGGMALIALRTELVEAPLVPAGMEAVTVTGHVAKVEQREGDTRYTVRVESLSGLERSELPRKVRIVWRGEGDARAGDRVSIRAELRPPPGPAVPGGYDFSRQMRYQGIGGSGFSYAPPAVLERGGSGFGDAVQDLREKVADRIEGVIGGPEGAIAAALATGKRERIPEFAVSALRDAGLAHLLAISGLHMGLVCGFLFWGLRTALVRSERLTLNFPVKKWAAAGALLGGLFYLAMSGGGWSAQRAYIMAAVVFGAILFDRRGISLRNVAVAAIIIMVIRPEAVAAPGFQMSFAAVITLIAAFSFIEERWPREGERTRLTKAMGFTGGLFLTSLLAGLATGPFAAFHFGRIASYGLLGNMLAMPIVTLAVMPALVLAMFLMPLGLDALVLLLVGQGLGMVLRIAQWTAGLPGAAGLVPQLAPAGIVLASAGLLTLALLRAPWRLAGAAFLALALPLSFSAPPPDVYISRDLRNVGVVTGDPARPLAILSKRRDRFTVEAWLQAIGSRVEVKSLDAPCRARDVACSVGGLSEGQVIILSGREGLAAACDGAALVILRSRALPGDAEGCSAELVALDSTGRFPATTLRWAGGKVIRRSAKL